MMHPRNVIVGVAIAVGLAGTTMYAQGQGRGGRGGPPDVKVTIAKLAGNVYGLDGRGGRMVALVGSDGVVAVDAQFPDVTDKLVAALKTVSDGHVRILINTHLHGDHTGGNENFARMGTIIMGRTNERVRMMHGYLAAGGRQLPPAPALALPVVTYDQPVTLHLDGEDVQLLPLPPGHTDGDTAVRFVNANVIDTGDVFRAVGFPVIDRDNGGTLKGTLDGLQMLIDLAGPNTVVVPPHGAVTNRAALMTFRNMIVTVRDRVAKAKAAGKTEDEVVAMKPTAEFDERVGNAAQTADRFVRWVYQEL